MFSLCLQAAFLLHVCFVRCEMPDDFFDFPFAVGDNSSLWNGTGDGASTYDPMTVAGNFRKEFRSCVEKKYDRNRHEVNDESTVELRTYRKLCTNPTGFAMCMIKNNDMNLFYPNIRRHSMMFCGEVEPEMRKQPNEATICLENMDQYLGMCLEGQVPVMALLSSFSTDMVDHLHEVQCEPYVEVMKCFKEKLGNCHKEALPFAVYLESWIGGDCLADHEVLNHFATVEVCDSASIGAPSFLLTLLVSILLLPMGVI